MFNDENELVDKIYESIDQREVSSLREVYKRVNLASRKFKRLWSKWWRGSLPPRLEVDLIAVFKQLEEVSLIAIEVKYFKPHSALRFSSGLEQTLSYSLFGFDGVALWQIFSKKIDDSRVENSAKALDSVVKTYNLPIFCLVAKIDNPEEMTFCHFSPVKGYGEPFPLEYYFKWMRNSIRNSPNPALDEKDVQRRRKTLKTLLGIPV